MKEQDKILLKKFMEKIWSGYSNNVYRALYNTYHPSTYNEGFSNPMDNMADATDEIDVAITKGENYGLIDKLTGYKFPESPELHIDEGTNTHRHPWMVSTLLFSVLWDIVDEFKHYCGENGIDPTGKGKCMGEFPYLYEDYNNLHDYMEELEDLGAPLDILLKTYQLSKIELSPDYPYRPHEHNHDPNRLEEVDKFLSRRLSVVRENIYTLSDGALLGEGEQYKLENQMCELFNLPRHESSEQLFRWSIKDMIKVNESTVTESGLSPELEIGDVIKVIDIDRERERGKTQYTTPGEQMRPEKFVPYTVVDKKSNGSQSKWSWKYTLVPPNKLEAYEKSLDRGWGNYEGYEKLLYPWIYEWIPADTPMANKVDRLTLTEWEGEHEPITQKELNPELEKGDHVKIISIDGEHANMPKKWEVYVVNSVHGDKYQNQRHYGLYPMDQTDEQLTSSMLAGGGKRRELYLYRGDEWMKVKNSQLNPLIKKLNGMEIEIDTTKYDLGYVDEETGESTGNLFFEITNPRFSPISYGGDSPVRNDMFHYDLLFTKEESGILVDWFDKEELEKMFNQDGIKGKINKAVYENYLKLYGIPQKYVRVQEILVDNLLLGLDFRNNFVSESYDNEDLCDELTISTEEELREKLEGMSIGKEDRDEIEGLIGNMLSDTEHLHPGLPSVESETDFDISNTYGRKIQSILCTHERKNISNIDEESTILETFEVISDLNKAIVVN